MAISRRSEALGLALDKDLALAGMVGRADETLLLHALDQRRRAVVADRKTALDIGRRRLAVAQDNRNSLVIEIVRLLAADKARRRLAAKLARLTVIFGDRFEIIGMTLRLQMADNLLDLLVADERSVNALDASAAGHIEHVALT